MEQIGIGAGDLHRTVLAKLICRWAQVRSDEIIEAVVGQLEADVCAVQRRCSLTLGLLMKGLEDQRDHLC